MHCYSADNVPFQTKTKVVMESTVHCSSMLDAGRPIVSMLTTSNWAINSDPRAICQSESMLDKRILFTDLSCTFKFKRLVCHKNVKKLASLLSTLLADTSMHATEIKRLVLTILISFSS